jgi:hypothetical protein
MVNEEISANFAGAATNAMGGSSSTAGTGPIDTIDPLIKSKKLRAIVKRKTLSDIKHGK